VRGRRTTLVEVLVAVLAAGLTGACTFGTTAGPEPTDGPTLVAVEAEGEGNPPELTQRLEVELGTAVAVFGLGCRPQSDRQRCSTDGEKTYTLTGSLLPATMTAAWMQLDAGDGRWAVHVRIAGEDEGAAARTSRRAQQRGGLVVILDAASGDVLQAVSPNDVRGTRITRYDLHRLTARGVVAAFVDAT
jgi:hypothetical protein